MSWDWPRAGQLEPHLSSPRHSQEGCALRQASCSGCTPPPVSVSRSSPLPRDPCSGGCSRGRRVPPPAWPVRSAALSPGQAAPWRPLLSDALRSSREWQAERPSPASDQDGDPSLCDLGRGPPHTASRGPASLPAQPLWAQPRGLQPTHVSGFFALSSRPHDRARSCPEPGSPGLSTQAAWGGVLRGGSVWGGLSRGRLGGPTCRTLWGHLGAEARTDRPALSQRWALQGALSEAVTEEGTERPVLGACKERG